MKILQRRIQRLLRQAGTARARDLAAAGIPRTYLSRLVAAGQLVRLARGVYTAPGHELTEHAALVIVARRAPDVVFCLLTALRFHGLTTQAPFEVWIAIRNKAHPPKFDYPQVRVIRFASEGLTEGIETHRIDGATIRVTNAARTVADCFKFRNKIGLDVALEALREARRSRKASTDDLWRYAKLDRVSNVMRPYLEAVS